MAKITIKGLDEYALRMSRLQDATKDVSRAVVYKGAEVVADAIKSELKKLPIDNGHGTKGNPINGVNKKQKSDLIESFGVAPMENNNGYVHTKVGFSGYGSVPTLDYPQGVPNQVLARSVNSGTYFRKKNPFIRRALNKTKEPAVKAMGEKLDELIKKII